MMKKLLLLTSITLLTVCLQAQVKVSEGPALVNNPDNKMNRMVGANEKSFYCYRIRTKGKGTSYCIEKYNKLNLTLDFSTEIVFENINHRRIEAVEYNQENIIIFIRNYDKEAHVMSLYCETITANGVLLDKAKNIVSVNSDHFEFVNFNIYPNPSKTRFLIKTLFKENGDAEYKTDFILLNAADLKQVWVKRIKNKIGSLTAKMPFITLGYPAEGSPYLGSPNSAYYPYPNNEPCSGFIGLQLDDSDNVFYANAWYDKIPKNKGKRYTLDLSLLMSGALEPKITTLMFDNDYRIQDIKLSLIANGEIVVGGFFKSLGKRKSRRVGAFSFIVKISDGSVVSKSIKLFDDKLWAALSSINKAYTNNYTLDYVLSIGEEIYFIGQQYIMKQTSVSNRAPLVDGGPIEYFFYNYRFMDILIAKLNAKGEFEWIHNVPMNNIVIVDFPHCFRQYIAVATPNSIYLMHNENSLNADSYKGGEILSSDLKSMNSIHGTNFVYTKVSLPEGTKKQGLVFINDTYCFAPIQEKHQEFIPSKDDEIFIRESNNEIFIYTEDRGNDKFARLTFEK